MKIGIIGAGNVGTAIGEGLAKVGYEVTYGVRDKIKTGASLVGKVRTVNEAIAESEVIFLTVPWKAAQRIATSIHDWSEKILVDCTNPINSTFTGLEVGQTTSGAEMIQVWAKGARVVKAFNQTGYENIANSRFRIQPVMFIASDDVRACSQVAELAKALGFETVEFSTLALARQLEQFAWLWIYMAFKTNAGRSFAFGLLRPE